MEEMRDNTTPRTKRQHILPQSYLKRFADGEQVWVHNFQQKASYINNISDAACIADFYTVQTKEKQKDDSVEKALLAPIEGVGNPIIKKMINKMHIPTGKEKALFANYLAITYARGIWFRQILLEVYEHFANYLVEKLITDEQFFNQTMENFRKETGINEDLTFEQAKEVHENSETGVNIPRTYYVKEMMLYAAPLVNVFYHMNFNLIYVPPFSKAKFITSDKPIAVMTNSPLGKYEKWLEDPEALLYFPLSSHSCLMLDFKKEPKVISAKRSNVASINGLIANECVQISLSQEQGFIWLRKNMTVSDSVDELFDLLSEDKKTQPRVNNIFGQKLKSKCRSDINVLRGKDD